MRTDLEVDPPPQFADHAVWLKSRNTQEKGQEGMLTYLKEADSLVNQLLKFNLIGGLTYCLLDAFGLGGHGCGDILLKLMLTYNGFSVLVDVFFEVSIHSLHVHTDRPL
jgi:hypothetical protein